MSDNIEDNHNAVLASRVWSGSEFHYPYIDKMKARVRELATRNAVLAAEVRAWRDAVHVVTITNARAATDAANALEDGNGR